MDYKNTPEGRAVQSKYGKILHASRPEPPHNHPRMPMSNRAKIFSPFAALRGYEDEIASEGRDHLKGNRIELSEEGKEVLNQKISQLWKGQEITIKYFTDGYYENVAGVLDAVDVINKELRIYGTYYRTLLYIATYFFLRSFGRPIFSFTSSGTSISPNR